MTTISFSCFQFQMAIWYQVDSRLHSIIFVFFSNEFHFHYSISYLFLCYTGLRSDVVSILSSLALIRYPVMIILLRVTKAFNFIQIKLNCYSELMYNLFYNALVNTLFQEISLSFSIS